MNGTHPMFTMRCADCGVPLAEGPLYTAQGEHYCENHIREHVREKVCDFCNDPRPVLRFTTVPEAMLSIGPLLVSGDFLSCDACAMIIARDDMQAMVEKVMTSKVPPGTPMREDIGQTMGVYFAIIFSLLDKDHPTIWEG